MSPIVIPTRVGEISDWREYSTVVIDQWNALKCAKPCNNTPEGSGFEYAPQRPHPGGPARRDGLGRHLRVRQVRRRHRHQARPRVEPRRRGRRGAPRPRPGPPQPRQVARPARPCPGRAPHPKDMHVTTDQTTKPAARENAAVGRAILAGGHAILLGHPAGGTTQRAGTKPSGATVDGRAEIAEQLLFYMLTALAGDGRSVPEFLADALADAYGDDYLATLFIRHRSPSWVHSLGRSAVELYGTYGDPSRAGLAGLVQVRDELGGVVDHVRLVVGQDLRPSPTGTSSAAPPRSSGSCTATTTASSSLSRKPRSTTP